MRQFYRPVIPARMWPAALVSLYAHFAALWHDRRRLRHIRIYSHEDVQTAKRYVDIDRRIQFKTNPLQPRGLLRARPNF